MIDLYTWGTPNGRKVSVALEELALNYQVFPIDITKNEQFAPDFLKISPNNKIPAIVDHDAAWGQQAIFESGAILIYLAEKTGRLIPTDPKGRYECLQWLMWQMGGLGPMAGQAHHFRRFAPEPVPYAVKRYTDETARLYGVLNKRLGETRFLANDTYTIADITTYPWIARHEWQGVDLATFPQVKRWFDEISARPAVKKGFEVP